jgi:hypothetical protein
MKFNVLRLLWPLLVGFILLLAGYLYYVYNWSDNEVKYHFYYFYPITYLLAFILIPIGIILTLFILLNKLRRKNKYKAEVLSLILGLITIIGANFLACGGAFNVFLITLLDDYRQLDSKVLNNSLYRLDYEWKPGVGGDHREAFYLMQCDSISWICKGLYTDYHSENVPYPKDVSGKLIVSSDAKTLEVELNGIIIYHHSLEDSP